MDIDFIKWMCEKAEGFYYCELCQTIETPCSENTFKGIAYLRANQAFYPLLLQRAMNDEYKLCRYTVIPVYDKDEWEINLYDFDDMRLIKCSSGKTYDNAMESALLYVYEQERKDG